MERVIKIRWFRRRTKEMVYDLTTTIYPDGSFGTDEDSEWTIFGGLLTGLKDKNGVEIYEGDILNGVSNNPFSKGDENNYEVMFGVDSWHVKGTNFGLQELFNYCNNNVAVIGNIHENPELL